MSISSSEWPGDVPGREISASSGLEPVAPEPSSSNPVAKVSSNWPLRPGPDRRRPSTKAYLHCCWCWCLRSWPCWCSWHGGAGEDASLRTVLAALVLKGFVLGSTVIQQLNVYTLIRGDTLEQTMGGELEELNRNLHKSITHVKMLTTDFERDCQTSRSNTNFTRSGSAFVSGRYGAPTITDKLNHNREREKKDESATKPKGMKQSKAKQTR